MSYAIVHLHVLFYLAVHGYLSKMILGLCIGDIPRHLYGDYLIFKILVISLLSWIPAYVKICACCHIRQNESCFRLKCNAKLHQ